MTAFAAVIAVSVALAGCAEERAPAPTPIDLPGVSLNGDGSLLIATVFDMATTGGAEVAGTELAVREINAEGGVLGSPVVALHRNSAGDPAALGAELVGRGTDAVLWDGAGAPAAELLAALESTGTAVLSLRDIVTGTPATPDDAFAARLRTADPGLAAMDGGAGGYDAVMLLALAAAAAGADGGASLVSRLGAVSTGTVECVGWGACAAAIADEQSIRYLGESGPIEPPVTG
ncbi:hypothetical protein [Luethyella okanaganae]|uniref:Leucine-binding protein domain-containing protein n=1 Tax=Luethyella okanaganae TaxID=69372 RepID=A0ABW1VK27_9MICO